MNKARVRRGAVALLTSTALLIAPALFMLAPASAAGATITILNSKRYTDPIAGQVIVGELQNTGSGASGLVSITVTWLDSSGAQIGSPDFLATATVEVIPAGTPSGTDNRSPFVGNVTPPANTASYTLQATPSDASAALNHNFTVTVTQRFTSGGVNHLKGTVTNNNTTTAEFVSVVATLYDSAGKADDQATEVNSGNASLAPGASGPFEVLSEANGRSYSSFAILAQSSTQPAPAPSTSPSVAPTDSASPSATDSPSPSASPPPPASPLPCRTGGGTYAIASSPAYAKIPILGRVRLSATLLQSGRVCQAGLRLNLYARGPGTTLYHLSKYGVTSSTGRVLFDYTGVRADFRWYVLGGGAHSATNLVQAR